MIRRRRLAGQDASWLLALLLASLAAYGDDDIVASLAHADELRAERKYEAALARYLDIAGTLTPDHPRSLHWRALYGVLGMHNSLGQREQAASLLPELYALAADDEMLLSQTARAEASLLHRQGRLAEAEAAARRSLEHALASGDIRLQIDAYMMTGTILSLQARNVEALSVNERALALQRSISQDGPRLINMLNSVAIDLRHLGRFAEALPLLQEALGLSRGIEDPELIAQTLFNQSSIYLANGELRLAHAALGAALDTVSEIGHAYGLALVHGKLASVYLEAGNLDRAQSHAAASLAISRDSNQPYSMVTALLHLSRISRQRGDWQEAVALARDALALAGDSGFGAERVAAQIVLAQSLRSGGRVEEALHRARQAYEDAVEQDDVELEADALEILGQASEAAGLSGQALDAYLAGIDLLESWRGRLAVGDLKATVGAAHWLLYEGAIRVMFRTGRTTEAFAVSERSRARLLRELIADRAATGSDRLAQLRRLAREQRAERAQQEWTEYRGRLLEEDPRRARLMFPDPRPARTLLRQLAGPGKAAVAFFWGEDDVYAWWIDAAGVRGARLGSARDLSRQAEFLAAAVRDPASPVDWRRSARRAYADWIEPLAPGEVRQLLVIADGPLAAMPLGVLIDAEDRPLGADAEIRYLPSAAIIGTGDGRQQAPVTHTALVVAYSPQGEDARSAAALPHANLEAQLVRSSVRAGRVTVLRNGSATLDAWLGAGPGSYRLLHFATHGIIDDRQPQRSHLLLSQSRLDLATIRRLVLGAELVTLSACESARGRQVRGEGLIGLTHAFLVAGAGAVLATGWRVQDEASARFMGDFYRRSAEGSNYAAALRDVQADWYGRQDRFSHPALWGSYMLFGALPPLSAAAVDAALFRQPD